jgi:PST family polysaccharide transporter
VLLTSITLPFFLGLAATAPTLVPVLLGSKWLDAVYPIQVLSIVAALQVIVGISPLILNAIGKPVLNVYFNLISSVIFGVGFVIGAKWLGLSGVLLAWLILFPIRSIVILLISTMNIQLSLLLYIKRHLRVALSGILMFILVASINALGLEWPQEAVLGLQILIGAVSYLVLVFMFSRDIFDEIYGLLRRKKQNV